MGGRSYQMYAFYRFQVLAMCAISAAVSVGLLVALAVGTKGGPPVLFSLGWIAIAAWNGYWFLFRVAYRLNVDHDVLLWSAPLRGGTVPLADIQELRPFRLGSSVEVISQISGPPILVWARKGLRDFADDLCAEAPHIRARFGWYAKLAERLPGPRGFKRE